MNEQLLFESKGWIKSRQIILLVCGSLILLIGLISFFIIYEQTINYNPWVNSKPDIFDWMTSIFLLVFGLYPICIAIISRKSYLKIFDNHIEARSFDFLHILVGGNGSSSSNIIISFDEIKGVSSQRGTVTIETTTGKKNILCSDCSTAEKMILQKIYINR